MSKDPKLAALDIEGLRPWLDDPDCPLAELRERLPFLRSDAEARRFLDDVREGLASAERGGLLTTDELVRTLEERRRARRAAA